MRPYHEASKYVSPMSSWWQQTRKLELVGQIEVKVVLYGSCWWGCTYCTLVRGEKTTIETNISNIIARCLLRQSGSTHLLTSDTLALRFW